MRTLEDVHVQLQQAAEPQQMKLQVAGADLHVGRQHGLEEKEEGWKQRRG